jgi:hypothetical protein
MGKRNSGGRWAAANDFPLTNSDPWRLGVPGAVHGGTGKYTSNERVLTSKPSDTLRDDPWGTSVDIYDEVCAQDSDDGNRAVKSGGRP